MAINLKINVDSKPVVQLGKQIDDINDKVNKTGDSGLDNFNQDVKSTNESLEKTVKTISSLEAELTKLNEELSNTEIGTKTFRDLEQQVIKTSGELKNLELVRESLDNEQFAGELKSVAGGLGDVAGGLALVGVSGESAEKVVQTFAQVEGITKLATGAIEAYSSGVKVLNALSTKSAALQTLFAVATGEATVAQAAGAVATGVASVAMTIFNAVLSVNPIFLLVTAIAAAVAAFAMFSGSTRDVTAENDKLNASFERQSEALDRLNDRVRREGENRLKLAQAAGASEEELLKIQLDNIDKEEKGRIKSKTVALREIEAKKKLYLAALEEEDQELAKKIKGEIAATRKKYKDLKDLDGQYLVDKRILTTQAETKRKEDAKKEAEKDAKEKAELRKQQQEAYNKRLEDQKRYNEERLAAARRIKDLELSLLPEGIEKERAIQNEASKRELEDLQKKYGDRSKLNKQLLDELTQQEALLREQNAKKLADIDKKYDQVNIDAAKKANDLKIQQENEYQATLEKIAEENYQATLTNQQREIQAVNDKYFALEVAAEDNAEELAIIEEAKNRELAAINKKYSDEEIAKRREELKTALEETASIFNEVGSNLGDPFLSALGNTFTQASQFIDVFNDETKNKLEKTVAGISAISSIASSFISAQQANIEKEREKGNISAEKAFEKSKKLQIAQATITGLQGAISAYSSLAGIPIVGPALGAAAAAAIAALTVSNISKIKSTKFDSESSSSVGGSTSPSSSTTGGGSQQAQPSFNLFGQGNNANTFGPGANNQNQQMQVQVQSQVSVSEINEVQNKVAVQEDRATL